MKTTLTLIVIGASLVSGFSQQFNGTIFDVDTGRFQVINGSVERPYVPYQPQIDTLKRINAELSASISAYHAASEAQIIATRQLRELEEQTRLLRKIANE